MGASMSDEIRNPPQRGAKKASEPGTKGSKKAARKRPAKVTMMDQFQRAKKGAPGALLFFRMGDFYELFGDDAKVASRELGIALTSRAKDGDGMPMAGVPVRSLETHLMKLVSRGHKVAICEQIGDPRKTKGIVARDVVRVVTAGTITEENALDAKEPNWLASLAVNGGRAGLAWVDLSTGRFLAVELDPEQVPDELVRIGAAELLWSEDLTEREADMARAVEKELGSRITRREPWRWEVDACRRILLEQLGTKTLEGFGFDDDSVVVQAGGALIEYLRETQRGACEHVRRLEQVDTARFLVLDRATRSCLELTQTQREARREGTLLDIIDSTVTPMGGRLMREWLLAPLRDVESIRERQTGVSEFVDAPFLREDVRAELSDVLDVERLAAKVSTGRANARDVVALASSLAVVTPLRAKLENVWSKALGEVRERLDPLTELVTRVQATLVDAPPATLREGDMVRAGYDPELDELRQIAGDAKAWMARFQAQAIEESGLPGLKIGFTTVFGYYLEVPRGQVERVPETWIRKQTLKNAERYVTPELKEFEDKVLTAEERSREMEYDIFTRLREEVALRVPAVLATARALAELDVLHGLAQTAAENRYVAPVVDGGDTIKIKGGRHPVIEQIQTDEAFVPNDTEMNRKARMVSLLTGPNMAGKSTYVRQTALIVLLAQIGSFVPASEARVGVVDRIFTRIGSADDIGRGASTFMVEMVEIANIQQRDRALAGGAGRGRPWNQHLRRARPRLGDRRVPAREHPRSHPLRDSLPSADLPLGPPRGCAQPLGRGARVGGRDRVPAPDRRGGHRSLVRHPGRAAGGRAGRAGRARQGDPG